MSAAIQWGKERGMSVSRRPATRWRGYPTARGRQRPPTPRALAGARAVLRAVALIGAIGLALIGAAQRAHAAMRGQFRGDSPTGLLAVAGVYSTRVTFAPALTYGQALELITSLGLQPAIGCGATWQPMGQVSAFALTHQLLVEPGYLAAPDDWRARLAVVAGVTAIQDAVPAPDQSVASAVPTLTGGPSAGAPSISGPSISGANGTPVATPTPPPTFALTYACPPSADTGDVAGASAASAFPTQTAHARGTVPAVATPVPTPADLGTDQSGAMARVTFAPWVRYDGALAAASGIGLGLADPCYAAETLNGAEPLWHPMGQRDAYATTRTLIIQTNAPVTARDWEHRLWATSAVMRIEPRVAVACTIPPAMMSWLVSGAPDLALIWLAALLASGLALLAGALSLGRSLARHWQALRWLGNAVPVGLAALVIVPLGMGSWTIVIAARTLTLYQSLTCPACWPPAASATQLSAQVALALVGGLIALAVSVLLLRTVPLAAAWSAAPPQNVGALPMPILPRYGTAPASEAPVGALDNGLAPPAPPGGGWSPANTFRDTPPTAPVASSPAEESSGAIADLAAGSLADDPD